MGSKKGQLNYTPILPKCSVPNYFADNVRIDSLQETDILMGPGNNTRKANVRFLNVVWQLKDEYINSRIGTKRFVVEKAINMVCFEMKPPSRFVEKRSDGYLYMVPRQRILQKVKRAFFDIVKGRVKNPPSRSVPRNFNDKDRGEESVHGTGETAKAGRNANRDGSCHESNDNEEKTRNDDKNVVMYKDHLVEERQQHNLQIQRQLQTYGREEQNQQDCKRQQQQPTVDGNDMCDRKGKRKHDSQECTHPDRNISQQQEQQQDSTGCNYNKGKKFMSVKPQRRDSFDLEHYGIKFETLSSVIDTVLLSEL